jgi:hypothetical protein
MRPGWISILPKSWMEVRPVIGDKREVVFDDSFRQHPVRPAAQAEMVGMHCFKARGVGQSYQRLMEALVNQEPHAVSRLLSGMDLLPRGCFPCQGRRLGRPRRGNACMYNGAMAMLCPFNAG